MAIANEIHERPREIVPGVTVGRVLPARELRRVGPFVFFDHGGPFAFAAGTGMDVAPHPHIGLATVTYVIEGEVLHRDSLGNQQLIRPGEINWMSAGRGIAHSERTPPEVRARGSRAHILQLWVGLPKARELDDPQFRNYGADRLPLVDSGGARVRLLAGDGWGLRSPVETATPTFFAEAQLAAGAEVHMPPLPEGGAFVIEGRVRADDRVAEPGTLLAFSPDASPVLHAEEPSRVALIGGEPLDGPRYIWWNFVASAPERIVEAAHQWRDGKFAKIPGDEIDFVPLPGEPHLARPS
jgi:redox-sensitive bicupin YhaK (pirin superfamily)